ncbi:MAG: hypothetical protein Q9159_002882 [Coniocarpon cinnabarinum]
MSLGTAPRRRYATESSRPAQTSRIAYLSHRRLLIVHGHDAAHFLQGLTTNNVPTTWASSGRDGFYSAFLNAQGRLLHDVFIYPASACSFYRDALLPENVKAQKGEDEPGFIIEADADGVQDLYKHLRRYKLRAKVNIWILEPAQATIMAAFRSNLHGGHGSPLPREDRALRCIDNRNPGFGTRVIMQPGSTYEEALKSGMDVAALTEYHRARHRAGIPEGQKSTGGELPYANSLPHETNIDLMGGIDFRKGCYVGQELTIRTQHKGVVRKRLLPVSLYSTPSGHEAGMVRKVQEWTGSGASVDIIPKGRRGRPAGRWITGVPNDQLVESKSAGGNTGETGLAMCRLETMTDVVVEAGGDGGGVKFKEGDEFVLRPKWEDDGKQALKCKTKKWSTCTLHEPPICIDVKSLDSSFLLYVKLPKPSPVTLKEPSQEGSNAQFDALRKRRMAFTTETLFEDSDPWSKRRAVDAQTSEEDASEEDASEEEASRLHRSRRIAFEQQKFIPAQSTEIPSTGDRPRRISTGTPEAERRLFQLLTWELPLPSRRPRELADFTLTFPAPVTPTQREIPLPSQPGPEPSNFTLTFPAPVTPAQRGIALPSVPPAPQRYPTKRSKAGALYGRGMKFLPSGTSAVRFELNKPGSQADWEAWANGEAAVDPTQYYFDVGAYQRWELKPDFDVEKVDLW